jgi:NAD(P)-dependent dehydrogenase (short-subunit alcohol dehydrogenase family)/carbon monoxide dehydrogenase subunit G
MIRLEETIEVGRPITEAFRYTADFENLEQWDPGVSHSKKLTPGPPGKGTEYRVVVKSGPSRIPMRYVVTEYAPPDRVVLEGEGARIRAVDSITFEPRGSGTRIRYVADLSFSGWLASAEPLMRGTLDRVGKRAVRGLEAALNERGRTPDQKALNLLLDRAVLPGLVRFSRLGYKWQSRRWAPASASLEGRSAVVTGATSGLGRAAALGLSRKGARVILVGRNPEKTEEARRQIVEETGNPEIGCRIADLSLMDEVRGLAERLLAEEPAIHVLVNNAGALFPDRALTREGIERTLALDLLSPFLLTNLLLPRMTESRPARIVNVSSGGMYTQRIRVDDLQYEKGRYSGSVAYARAKRGLVILTEMWAGDLQGKGVVVHSMHPGWADTPGVSSSLPAFYKATKKILRTPEEGADTIVWLAASREAALSTGRFWLDRQPHTTHVFPGTRETEEERKRLREELARLTGCKAAT